MGNFLSKIEPDSYINVINNIGCRSKPLRGSLTHIKAHAVELHLENSRTILTPICDRFPPQACNLKVDRFNGVSYHRSVKQISIVN